MHIILNLSVYGDVEYCFAAWIPAIPGRSREGNINGGRGEIKIVKHFSNPPLCRGWRRRGAPRTLSAFFVTAHLWTPAFGLSELSRIFNTATRIHWQDPNGTEPGGAEFFLLPRVWFDFSPPFMSLNLFLLGKAFLLVKKPASGLCP
jgi:hypothetical protein